MNAHHTPRTKAILLIALLALTLFPIVAMASGGAGGGGNANIFDQIYQFLRDLLSGSLGKFLTILSLAVALAIAVKMQSVIGILTSFAIALTAVYGPGALEMLFTASLPPELIAVQATSLTQGLAHGAALTPLP